MALFLRSTKFATRLTQGTTKCFSRNYADQMSFTFAAANQVKYTIKSKKTITEIDELIFSLVKSFKNFLHLNFIIFFRYFILIKILSKLMCHLLVVHLVFYPIMYRHWLFFAQVLLQFTKMNRHPKKYLFPVEQ